jgi:hypothetical protein
MIYYFTPLSNLSIKMETILVIAAKFRPMLSVQDL